MSDRRHKEREDQAERGQKADEQNELKPGERDDVLKIRSLEFVGSFTALNQPIPSDLPSIAFSGRSNVGKSSLINSLLRRTRHRIAKVSGTPGKTQTLNFYRVNEAFYLVDLPGFGYAKVGRKTRESWRKLIDSYLTSEFAPNAMVHLIDSRREPMAGDLEMLEWLAEVGIPTMIVLTKTDKLSARQREKAVATAAKNLRLEEEQLLPYSAVTAAGREDLLFAITDVLELPGEAT